MNKVWLIGRLTKDVELKTVGQNNQSFCRFTLAVDRSRKDDDADFINCVAWGKTAELICRFNGKGNLLAVVGRIQTGSYIKDGQRVYTTDIVCEEVKFLSPKKKDEFVEDINEFVEKVDMLPFK